MINVKQFSADWCQSCKVLSKNLEGKEIEYVDVEDNIELSAKFGIRNLPTLLFFKDGVMIDKSVGVISAEKFEEIVEKWQ